MTRLKLTSKSVVLVPCRTHLDRKAWSTARRGLCTRWTFIRSLKTRAHQRKSIPARASPSMGSFTVRTSPIFGEHEQSPLRAQSGSPAAACSPRSVKRNAHNTSSSFNMKGHANEKTLEYERSYCLLVSSSRASVQSASTA
jgi:hypothetical protein